MPEEAVIPLTLAPKQLEGLELCRTKRFPLFSGPRKSAKTMCGLTAICDHAWRTPHCDFAMVAVSQKAGSSSGVWPQLVDGIMPKFMALGQGMEWVKKPFNDSASKQPKCVVRNAYGGESHIQLESLKDEREVEERFKTKNYTGMFVSELSNFKSQKTFTIWSQALRSIHGLRDDQFLLLTDTNPSDEGDESWIYHLWFVYRTQAYNDYCVFQAERDLPIIPERSFEVLKKRLGLLEFEINDNIFLSEDEVHELVAAHSHDKDLHDRFILGKWVKASTGALFARQFRENFHVAGELNTPGNPDPVMMAPRDTTWELVIGIDPGSSANSAGCIVEKIIPPANGSLSLPCFDVLDEVAIIGKDHTLDDFTIALCQKMLFWEQWCGRIFKWRYWSDRSVFEQRDNLSKKYYHQLIFEASARFWEKQYQTTKQEAYRDRRIELRAADRGAGTLPLRVDLARRILFENRLRVSRCRCPWIIQMFKALPARKEEADVPPVSHRLKHSFDSLLNVLAEESFDEVGSAIMRTVRWGRQNQTSGLVNVLT